MEEKEEVQVVNDDDYPAWKSTQKNVVLIGKTGVGKTSLNSILLDPAYVGDKKSSVAKTKDASVHPIVAKVDGKFNSITIIDTPGLYEVRSKAEEKRSNEQILYLISSCMKKSVTCVSAVLVLFKYGGTLTEEDMQLTRTLTKFFPTHLRNNTILVFTHAEDLTDEDIEDELRELSKLETMAPIRELCKGGIKFVGCTDFHRSRNNPSEKERVGPRVIKQRKELLKKITELPDVPIFSDSILTKITDGITASCSIM